MPALLASALLGSPRHSSCLARQDAAPPAAAVASSAPSLTTFRRNDGDRITRVRIDAAHTGRAKIDQNVFGNFVEHLGRAIYGTVWANALINPSLEKVAEADTGPRGWSLSGKAVWQEGGYLSPRCVRLSGPDATLAQSVFLPVHRIRRYRVTLHARAPAGPGRITISVRGMAARAGRIFAQRTLSLPGTDWSRRTFELNLPEDAPSRGDAEQFVIAQSGAADVVVDQVTLFPADAIDGLDPDVVRAARAWHIPVLRLAGNFSSGYHWRDGIGPRERRPTLRNPAWGGVESNEFGTDEFLEFARLIGATPLIAANAGNGTPDEAAAWVRYCNAAKRRVPVWEIGNELYGGWQIGHTDAPGNALRFTRFREAMRAADPKIQVIATGKGNEFLAGGLARGREWNDAVLRAAVAGGAPAPDYLSIHPLVALPGGLRGMSYREQYESAMAHPAFLDRTLLPALADQLRAVEGPGGRTRIAVTEWGIIVGGRGWQESPNHDVEAGAVFSALTLNALLRHAGRVTLANITALTHGGGIKKPNGILIVDPQYYTLQLYALAAPRVPVETAWDGPGQDVPARAFLPAAADVPDVDVFSALSEDRARLTVFMVNRHLNEARAVRMHVDGFGAVQTSAAILSAADPQARNTWEQPHTVAPRPFGVARTHGHSDWSFTLPPHSLVVLALRRAPDAGRAQSKYARGSPRQTRKASGMRGTWPGSRSAGRVFSTNQPASRISWACEGVPRSPSSGRHKNRKW